MENDPGEYKKTEWMNESNDLETLYFRPSYYYNGVISQSIAIASLCDRETSIIFYKLYENDKGSGFVHFILTEEETNAMIKALQENKKRWNNGNVIK